MLSKNEANKSSQGAEKLKINKIKKKICVAGKYFIFFVRFLSRGQTGHNIVSIAATNDIEASPKALVSCFSFIENILNQVGGTQNYFCFYLILTKYETNEGRLFLFFKKRQLNYQK